MTHGMKRILLPLGLPLLASLLSTIACTSREDQEKKYEACLQRERAAASSSAALPGVSSVSAALSRADQTSIVSALREKLKADSQRELAQLRADMLAHMRCDDLRPSTDDEMLSFDSSPSSGSPTSGAEGAKQASGTNNQVAGVDEADFVKNDNKYIYLASGSTFRIVEAWPAPQAREIAKVSVPGKARKLFVHGDRAVVYSSVASSKPGGYGGPGESFGCNSYGYNCIPSPDGTSTVISVFDVTNRAAPSVVRTIKASSSLMSARRIGNAVHTVLAEEPQLGASHHGYAQIAGAKSEEALEEAYAAALRASDKTIAELPIGSVIPTFQDSAALSPQASFYRSSLPDGAAFTTVLSLDLGADPSLNMTTVISRSGAVYASEDALYMAVPHQRTNGMDWYEGRSEDELSTVHKFSLGASPLATAYVGSGAVKGRVLNQFAMDEKDHKLRIATTTGRLPSPEAHNTLSVMESQGGKLDVIGQVDRIAPTEDIRSVRFDGDRGYMVTFKKTDPLYVFDLKDARAPRILGELKIPGFSTYMHMMDENHLLTIGYDADDKGDFAYFTGVLLQIFDVRDPKDPRLVHKEIIGTRGSSSEALADHLAFNYFAPKNMLALPMTVCEGGNTNGGYGTTMTFSGLMVYDVTSASGFSLRGKVAHPAASSQQGYGGGCSNWWSNASSEVRRSIFMDDFVFSISDSRIKVNRLDQLSIDVKDLSLL